MNTVTVSFLIITSRNFLSQRGSCRNLLQSYNRMEVFRIKKHLHLPFLRHVFQIPIFILVSLESFLNPEPESSFSLIHRFRCLMYHNLLTDSPGGRYLLQTTPCCGAQSCPTLCDPVDYSPPGSSPHGILQAGILEWAAISSSRGSS